MAKRKNTPAPVKDLSNTKQERTIEFSISAENLLTILRTTHGCLNNGEIITKVVFKNSMTGVDMKNNPTVVVPLEVTVVKEYGKNG